MSKIPKIVQERVRAEFETEKFDSVWDGIQSAIKKSDENEWCGNTIAIVEHGIDGMYKIEDILCQFDPVSIRENQLREIIKS